MLGGGKEMKYIITGHKGLIGQALKERLDLVKWKCVDAIDRREDSLTLTEDMADWKIKADIVFHLADNCKINECIKYPEASFDNVRGIQSVLEMCRKNKIKKIVYFSSSRVLNEETNPYTAGKVYGEELVKAYHKCYGIEYIIIRPSTVYGGNDQTNRLINIWLNNALKNKPLVIYGSEKKTLSFTYITDFIDSTIKCLKKWNQEYNIAGREEKLFNVAVEIIKQSNSKSIIKIRPIELEQPQKVKLKSAFKCKTRIQDGIKCELERLK